MGRLGASLRNYCYQPEQLCCMYLTALVVGVVGVVASNAVTLSKELESVHV
jgi:hypothetical protein